MFYLVLSNTVHNTTVVVIKKNRLARNRTSMFASNK